MGGIFTKLDEENKTALDFRLKMLELVILTITAFFILIANNEQFLFFKYATFSLIVLCIFIIVSIIFENNKTISQHSVDELEDTNMVVKKLTYSLKTLDIISLIWFSLSILFVLYKMIK